MELSCPITDQSLSHLHLYLHNTQTQMTLLSLSRGIDPRVNPKHRGRLKLSGGLHSGQVSVTLLHLETGDTGLYVWEGTENNGSEHITSDQRLFLLVDSEKLCLCSSVYPPLLFTLSGAAGLILISVSWIGIAHFVKSKQYKHRPSAPVYVEMSRKEQTVAKDIPETPSHLEEAQFPVYANPNYKLPQDNYYACPRQVGLMLPRP